MRYSYEDIRKWTKNGVFDPRHGAGPCKVTIKKGSISLQTTGIPVEILPGQVAGFTGNTVYRAIMPEEYSCPIRKVLAAKEISQGILVRSNEKVEAVQKIDEQSGVQGFYIRAHAPIITSDNEDGSVKMSVGQYAGLVVIVYRIDDRPVKVKDDSGLDRMCFIHEVLVREDLNYAQIKQLSSWMSENIEKIERVNPWKKVT